MEAEPWLLPRQPRCAPPVRGWSIEISTEFLARGKLTKRLLKSLKIIGISSSPSPTVRRTRGEQRGRGQARGQDLCLVLPRERITVQVSTQVSQTLGFHEDR